MYLHVFGAVLLLLRRAPNIELSISIATKINIRNFSVIIYLRHFVEQPIIITR